MPTPLTNENINSACENIDHIMVSHKTERHTLIADRLVIEDVLIKYQNFFGVDQEFEWTDEKKFGKRYIKLNIHSKSYNPFDGNEEDEVFHHLAEKIGIAPSWQYKNGCNIVTFPMHKKTAPSDLIKILIAIFVGIVLGILANKNSNVGIFFSEKIFAPIFDTVIGILLAFANVLIFLSVATGIYGTGDISALQKIGKRTIGTLLIVELFYELFATVLIIPFYSISTHGSTFINFSPIYNMLLDIVPKNIFTPFIENNTLQIIFLAICIGVALLITGNKTSAVQVFLMQANRAIEQIVAAILKFIPLIIFISIFQITAKGEFAIIISLQKMLLLQIFATVAILGICFLRIYVTKKISIAGFIKKTFPPVLIAFLTSSSIIAFPVTTSTCKNKLGIDKRIVDIGVPLGQIIFTPVHAITYTNIVLFLCNFHKIEVTVSMIIILIFMSYILGIATPPVPGGAIMCYMIFLKQFGIPVESIAVIVAIDFLLDRLATAAKIWLLQSELVQIAGKLKILDMTKLKARV